MKKITMMVLGLLMASAFLSGCYSTACSQPTAEHADYKDMKPSK